MELGNSPETSVMHRTCNSTLTYTVSYYNYSANLHKRLGQGKQITFAANGSHSGFSQEPGNVTSSQAVSSSLAVRNFTLTANYNQAAGSRF